MTDERIYAVACAKTALMSPLRFARLKAALLSAEAIWHADSSTLINAGLESAVAQQFSVVRASIDPLKLYEDIISAHVNILTLDDDAYPPLLREITDPPYVLFYRGTLKDSDEWRALGIVGARNASDYGLAAVHALAVPLVRGGYDIVSGLAVGIDSAAHRACLDAHGYTVAVLATSVEESCIYPRSNRTLAREIIEKGGALISEYPIGVTVERYHFPARNRIIAGLCKGVVIVQAKERSGSLITARHALEQNRDVFAVPGPITNMLSTGPNELLKQGAIPLTEADDIFSFYHQSLPPHNVSVDEGASEHERTLLGLLSQEPKHIDDVARAGNLDMSVIAATLLVMELKGMVKNIGAMRYIRS